MTLLLSPEFRRDVEKLSAADRRRIRDTLLDFRDKGSGDTRKVGKGLWRLRMGDYRIYYSTKGDDTYVLRLVHRTRAYRPETIKALLKRITSLEDGDS
jgi:mRNA-degrading endonuclease RelE of RelBE toxin-antitoxin system